MRRGERAGLIFAGDRYRKSESKSSGRLPDAILAYMVSKALSVKDLTMVGGGGGGSHCHAWL